MSNFYLKKAQICLLISLSDLRPHWRQTIALHWTLTWTTSMGNSNSRMVRMWWNRTLSILHSASIYLLFLVNQGPNTGPYQQAQQVQQQRSIGQSEAAALLGGAPGHVAPPPGFGMPSAPAQTYMAQPGALQSLFQVIFTFYIKIRRKPTR